MFLYSDLIEGVLIVQFQTPAHIPSARGTRLLAILRACQGEAFASLFMTGPAHTRDQKSLVCLAFPQNLPIGEEVLVLQQMIKSSHQFQRMDWCKCLLFSQIFHS
jgi:hypothetical protein